MKALVVFLLAAVMVVVFAPGPDDLRNSGDTAGGGERPEPRSTASGAPPSVDPAAAQADIEASVTMGAMYSIGHDGRRVLVSLRPGRDQIARDIVRTYGALAEVDVAGLRWPLRRGATYAGCGRHVPLSTEAVPVTAELRLNAPVVGVGEHVGGTLTLTNGSVTPIAISWGSALPALLVGREGSFVSGLEVRPTTSVLHRTTVPPGERSSPIGVGVQIASCTPTKGTAVPPGSYAAVVTVRLDDGRVVRSNDSPLEITPRTSDQAARVAAHRE